jgi:hypothetical protein
LIAALARPGLGTVSCDRRLPGKLKSTDAILGRP